ncbi:TlpA family protein disulfide reductase [Flavobacterium jejuense]|uniref:TlpA family protein disulfide reductase n=1 Tax=Flavobacterium jejuense TaxID=1544455 RepID=A0ABX0IM55_9FLAO|nr:TlpA disulfide reductase family protein [Flavobacterium jejuense]NHN24057.1 TlpA family protein disulfide reductase [Flavobacterium jejuense]
MKIILVFVIFTLFTNCKEENITPEEELNKVLSNINNRTSISYDLDYRIKYFDYPDTTNISAKTIIVKEKSDSLFGGSIWYWRKDSISDYIKYYDLNSFYIINNITNRVIRYNPKKPIPYGFTNNFDGKLLKTYFLQDKSLKKLLQDSIYKSKVSEERGLLKLSLVYPDEDEIVNQEKEIFFDKSLQTVKQIIFRAELDNLQEYNEWNLNNIDFNSYRAEDLEEKFRMITKDYVFTEYESPLKEENSPLTKGEKVEGFIGEYLTKNKSEFDLAAFSDNTIILDFWYRTCPPCIKSIPQLNSIYSKYKSKGVKLFGLNDIDTDSISRKQLIPFLHKEDIKYPLVLIDKTISEKYKVRAYPTLYIINKNGEIEYSKLGFSENMEKEVDSILKKILK